MLRRLTSFNLVKKCNLFVSSAIVTSYPKLNLLDGFVSQLFVTNCFYHRDKHANQFGRRLPLISSIKPLLIVRRRTIGENVEKRKEKLLKAKQQMIDTKDILKEKLDGIRENIFTLPNGLCMIRIALTPIIGYFVVTKQFDEAFYLFLFAGVTDLLDGLIARTFPSQSSILGSFLDPMADKLLVATLFATLTIVHLIPVALTLLIVSRDVILVGCSLYVKYKSLPEPRTIAKYFDINMATVQINPTFISKVNTVFQLGLVAVTLASPVFNFAGNEYFEYLWYLTAATTVTSGLSYLFTKDAYRYIRKQRAK